MNVAIRPFTVDLPTAAAIVGLSESTWQALVREGKAPKPRQLSDRRVGWLVREIEEWVEGRPASDLPPPANTGAAKGRNAEVSGASLEGEASRSTALLGGKD